MVLNRISINYKVNIKTYYFKEKITKLYHFSSYIFKTVSTTTKYKTKL